MCGIVAAVSNAAVNQELYNALVLLQHRGQDAAGILTADNDRLIMRKANGLVRDVFREEHMAALKGNVGIAHVRYRTQGLGGESEAQPFYVNSPYGIALAHNGNLTNARTLQKEILEKDLRHLNTKSDSEVLLNILAHELQALGKLKPQVNDFFTAVTKLMARCQGAYAVVALIANYGILAFRDPNGIRPLIYGKKSTEIGDSYLIASESAAIEGQGYELVNDVAAGEAIFISNHGEIFKQQCVAAKFSPCIFEYVYLARQDSVIDKVSVYQARLKMGALLADNIKQSFPNHDIDVVMPIPETSRIAALPLAQKLQVPYREGFVKNRYIGRTFIMPGSGNRHKSVRQKLGLIEAEFKNKNVLLVDDSIVRGTTSHEIVKMVRAAGAKKVYFASAAPAVKYPNIYGIDTPSYLEFIAHQRSDTQIATAIGADRVFYQSLEDLCAAVSSLNPNLQDFDCSIFNGEYVAGEPDFEALATMHNEREAYDEVVITSNNVVANVEIYNQ